MPEYQSWDDEPEEPPQRSAADITEAEKYQFLQLRRQGYDRREAALVLGYRARPWRALTSLKSPFYDEEFAKSDLEATNSLEAKLNLVDQIREEVKRRAFAGSERLLEKMAMVYVPEWAVLRQKNVEVNVRAILEQKLPQIPTELLQKVIAAIDAGETIEDAEILELLDDELPPGGNPDEPSEKSDGNDDPA